MKLSIKVKNIEEVKRFIKSRPEKLKKELNGAVSKSVSVIEQEAKKRTPVATGKLKTSIRTKTNQQEGEVGTNIKYAIYVHENLRARHPVGEAKFLTNAYKHSKPKIETIFKKAIKEVIKT